MSAWAAFLLGINVGGHRRVEMERLRSTFAEMGFGQVKTLLASGNVVFTANEPDAGALTQQIQAQLNKTFGFEIGVILRSGQQIRDLAKSDPFAGIEVTPQTRLYVTFLPETVQRDVKAPYAVPEGDFKILRVADGAVCSVLTLSERRNTTDAMNILGKLFGKKMTTRNWNTIEKILKVLPD